MFTKVRKIGFHKSGSGSLNCKLIIPNDWIKQLGITKEDNKVTVEFDMDKIIVKKYDEEKDWYLEQK